MTCERRLAVVRLRISRLPVLLKHIQHREDLGVPEAVDKVLHVRERVLSGDRSGV